MQEMERVKRKMEESRSMLAMWEHLISFIRERYVFLCEMNYILCSCIMLWIVFICSDFLSN